jgi:hypothetical protein
MMQMQRKPPLVEVTWDDAYTHTDAGTAEQSAKETPAAVRVSVGWLVRDDVDKLVVALTWDRQPGDEPDEYDDRLFIPRAYVKCVRYVERKPRAPKAPQETTT